MNKNSKGKLYITNYICGGEENVGGWSWVEY